MRRILFLTIFGLAGTAILLGLGNWQLQRRAWKQDILARIEAQKDAPPVALPATPDPVADKYLAVAVSGAILPGELHALIPVERGAGYRIIAPFETAGGRRILLERGFVVAADKAAARVTGPAEIVGNLHWPEETDGFTPPPDRAGNIWYARDVALMARALETEPVLLVARSQTDPGVTPLPVDTVRIPNDHLQYAITWFSLALIWVAMTVYFLWRTRARQRS